MHFVISRYKEDISWVNKLGSDFTIYNKDEDFVLDDMISLPNFGREAHTYLYYIITNYDNLPYNICFLQGNPFDHLNVDINNIKNIEFNGFLGLGIKKICDLNGYPQNPDLNIDYHFLNNYFLNKPEIIEYTVGAQFLVKRSNILIRKKNFYESILSQFYKDNLILSEFSRDLDPNAYDYIKRTGNKNKMPWLMERVWSYIFNPNFKTIYDNEI